MKHPVLKRNEFKTIFAIGPFSPMEAAILAAEATAMASAAVSSRGGRVGPRDDAPHQGWSCARRAGSQLPSRFRRASIQRRLMPPELPAVEIASPAAPVHRDQSSARPDGAGCCRFDRQTHVVTQRQRLSWCGVVWCVEVVWVVLGGVVGVGRSRGVLAMKSGSPFN